MIERDDVIKIVRQAFQEHRPAPLNVGILEDKTRLDGDVWEVYVMPREFPTSMSSFFEALAEVEIELEDDQNLKVLLLPIYPDQLAS